MGGVTMTAEMVAAQAAAEQRLMAAIDAVASNLSLIETRLAALEVIAAHPLLEKDFTERDRAAAVVRANADSKLAACLCVIDANPGQIVAGATADNSAKPSDPPGEGQTP